MERQTIFSAVTSINRLVYILLDKVVKPSVRSKKKIAAVDDILSKLVLAPSVSVKFDNTVTVEGIVKASKFMQRFTRQNILLSPNDKDLEAKAGRVLMALSYLHQCVMYYFSGYITYLVLAPQKVVSQKTRNSFITSGNKVLQYTRLGALESLKKTDPAGYKTTMDLFLDIERSVLKKTLNLDSMDIETLNNTDRLFSKVIQALNR